MRSDWRGLGRKMPAPNRSISKRDAPVAIISMAQHARPNVIGHNADLRAQLKRKSTVVVTMFFSNRFSIQAGTFMNPLISLSPIQCALLDNPDVPHDQNAEKNKHLHESEQHQAGSLKRRPVDDGPGKEKDGLDIEDYKKDRHDVVTDRVP